MSIDHQSKQSQLMEKTDTLVVGGGQAGIAMSEHLSNAGIAHIVLERDRIAERWRTGRWDSLRANGPAWHDRFPNLEFDQPQDDFPTKEEYVAYFENYVKKFHLPIRSGVEVTLVKRKHRDQGFIAQTTAGSIEAQRIVAATGAFQQPVIPPIAPQTDRLTQMHSAHYRNPDQLPAGSVMVIGAGSSGTQIADELQRAGRQVYLSVGAHDRPPRSYRGRDFCWWLGVLGLWDMTTTAPGKEHVTIAVSGAYGGKTIDFRQLAHDGITLVGMTKQFSKDKVTFEPDLNDNLNAGDASYLDLLDQADAFVANNGLNLPEEPTARDIPTDPVCVSQPILELDLAATGVSTIIWATGYKQDYSWLQVEAFDADNKPKHQRGVSTEPGIYFLGLPWQSRRGSSFVWGVWHDAKYIADQIQIQRSYHAYVGA